MSGHARRLENMKLIRAGQSCSLPLAVPSRTTNGWTDHPLANAIPLVLGSRAEQSPAEYPRPASTVSLTVVRVAKRTETVTSWQQHGGM